MRFGQTYMRKSAAIRRPWDDGKAARGVLKALLPKSGSDIKGHMRSYGELLEASAVIRTPSRSGPPLVDAEQRPRRVDQGGGTDSSATGGNACARPGS